MTTVDAECPADFMELNDLAGPANTDTNVFPRWPNGKSVIFNACCWADTVKKAAITMTVNNESWHRWSEPSAFKFLARPTKKRMPDV